MKEIWTIENIKFKGDDSPYIYGVTISNGTVIAMNKALLIDMISSNKEGVLNEFNTSINKCQEDLYVVTFKRK
jgi:hypothetical protein